MLAFREGEHIPSRWFSFVRGPNLTFQLIKPYQKPSEKVFPQNDTIFPLMLINIKMTWSISCSNLREI